MEPRSLSARPDVTVATTTPRVTPTPPRAGKFAEVLGRSVVRSAETAVRSLPGAPLMAVAVRGGAQPLPVMRNGMSGPEGPVSGASMTPMGVPGVGGVAGGAGGIGATGVGGGAPGEASSIEASLQQSADMNMYFLQVQEQVNAQNRSFTALSNVLKAQHDTVKTAIGNIR